MPAPDDQRPADLPRHVGIIMDGNGRWAAARGLPRLEGHRRGAERLIEIVDDCIDLGIGTLTVFAFSAENWKRPPEEISGLFRLGEWVLRAHLARRRAMHFGEGNADDAAMGGDCGGEGGAVQGHGADLWR